MAKGKEQRKVKKVMEEYSEGRLHSGSKKGPLVKDKAQAIAIGLSEARKASEKVSPKRELMHKKIMTKASKALKKDAKHYAAEAKTAKGPNKKHELIEKKEALSAAKDLSKRAKKAHEY